MSYDFDDVKVLFKRIFREGSLKRTFSVARFVMLIIGLLIASVFFAMESTLSGVLLAMLTAFLSYIVFRLGQIKGYLP